VQFLEIYNERIRDLLSPGREDLRVREDPRLGIHVEGATAQVVTGEKEVHELLRVGNKARAVAETEMNDKSSRSHSICIISLEQRNTVDSSKKRSKLFMVDLAGSEMVKHTGSEGMTLREAQHINKSLSALSNVITALSEKRASHIPYRNSKLTRILQEAIGGNCRTALILCVSPARCTETETVSTMRFGRSAKTIKNKARVNKESSDKELALQVDRH
jgi:kinesin family protein 5